MTGPGTCHDLHGSSVCLETVRAIWRKVLSVKDLEDDSDFYEAGGNSLLLVVLVEELSIAFGRTLKIMDVFRARSIQGQAELLAPGMQIPPRIRNE